jgi:hypothetical protein
MRLNAELLVIEEGETDAMSGGPRLVTLARLILADRFFVFSKFLLALPPGIDWRAR